MKLSAAMKRLKNGTHDVSNEYTNAEMLAFLNEAVQQITSWLISVKYPPLVKEVILNDGDLLPKNYLCSAGYFPIEITAGTVKLIDGYNTVNFRYFSTPEVMTITTEDLPYTNDAINNVIVKYAMMIALNENEFDLTQDKLMLDMLQQAIGSCVQQT